MGLIRRRIDVTPRAREYIAMQEKIKELQREKEFLKKEAGLRKQLTEEEKEIRELSPRTGKQRFVSDLKTVGRGAGKLITRFGARVGKAPVTQRRGKIKSFGRSFSREVLPGELLPPADFGFGHSRKPKGFKRKRKDFDLLGGEGLLP